MSDFGGPGPRLIVVVLNWNGRDDTVRCVRSLVEIGQVPERDIFVVDNASNDDSIGALLRSNPELRILENHSNLGFTGGMNRGISEALGTDPEFVCIMNNDTVVLPGMFESLMEVAQYGVVTSPEVRYLDRPDSIWFGGGVVELDRCWPRHLTIEELARADSVSTDSVSRVSETLAGCCILAQAQLWRSIGSFDDRYFLLFEDADWSARARSKGVAMVIVKRAVLLHAVSASFRGPGRLLASYYYSRNGLLFGRSHCRSHRFSRVRFVRDQVARPALRSLRQERFTDATSGLLFSGLGCLAAAVRQHGRAPTWIEGLAERITRPGMHQHRRSAE